MMEFFKTADVVVIGGGIVGTAILRELSKYDLKCVLVEKNRTLLQVLRKLTVLFYMLVLTRRQAV